jgi:hypothetical protein
MSDTPPDDGRLTGGRTATGKFAPGNKASRGKLPGERNRATLMAERLMSADAEAIVKKVVAAAKAGEPWAAKLVIERIIPPARDRATPFDLPPIAGPGDLPRAVQAVLDAASKGDLSIEDGERIVSLIGGLRQAFEASDLAAKLDAMQAKLDEMTARSGQ